MTTCPRRDQITFIPLISVLHVQANECHQFCWTPLLLVFLHLILDHLHRLLELMMGLKGLLWSNIYVITSSKPVLQISHSDEDLHLTGFTFDEVQVVILEDDSRDMVPMFFDQCSNTLVLSMMRGISYLTGLGLGHREQGPHEFAFTINHDAPYDLG
ncbi:hypothetical protein AAG906_001658 [Vitis piasezkii]